MSYIYAQTRAGRTILIEKYFSTRYHKKGIERSINRKKTSEEQEKVNQRRAVRKLTLQLNENFKYGDHHLVLDYSPANRPGTPEEAKRDREKFLRNLRKTYKRAESELKYIIVTEFGKRGALHHHLVINDGPSTRKIQSCWKKGRCHFNPMDETGEYSKLAAYLLKGRKYWKKNAGKGKQVSSSRSIVTPETEKKVIRCSNGYYEKPRPKKGYYIAPDTEFHGYREDGWPFTSYILVKEDRTRGP